ncbi:MAG TPA: hypothetical protein VNQ79_18460 [Blastocatellia bacterium]|nr:hypothetical protein [Blastocatellia bacterium]
MLARKKLKPGQPGTKQLLEEYGSRLLCVRYRCDPVTQTIVKTVEIIVEESEHKPRPRRIRDDQTVALRFGWKEYDLQRQVKQAGARWSPADRLWELRYDQVARLNLTERIVKKVANTGKSKISSTGN